MTDQEKDDLRHILKEELGALEERMEARFQGFETRMDHQVGKRLNEFEARGDRNMDRGLHGFGEQMDQRFEEFGAQVDQRFEKFQSHVDRRFGNWYERMVGEVADFIGETIVPQLSDMAKGIKKIHRELKDIKKLQEGTISRLDDHTEKLERHEQRISVLERLPHV